MGEWVACSRNITTMMNMINMMTMTNMTNVIIMINSLPTT